MSASDAPPPREIGRDGSIAIVASGAYSIANFRGPLISAFVARGFRVYALAPDFDERTRNATRAVGAEPIDCTLDRTGIRPVNDALDTLRMAALLRKLAPDIVFSYFIKPVIFGTIAAWLGGVKRRYVLVAGLGYVYAANDGADIDWRRRALRWLVGRLYGVAFALSDRIFFQNPDDRDELVPPGHRARHRTTLLNGTGVDLDRLEPEAPPSGPLTFLLMARLLKEKGIVEYVEAARIVRAIDPTARFLLLGDVDLNPSALTRAQVTAWADEGLIDWQGHVDDVRPWIAASSVYVLPSYYREGIPRSTQEAMAVGRAVITTDAIGCRETVEEGVNGFKVPVRDVPALAEAMTRFVDDPGLIVSMGAASRRLVERRFDVNVVNADILAAMGIESANKLAHAKD